MDGWMDGWMGDHFKVYETGTGMIVKKTESRNMTLLFPLQTTKPTMRF